MAGQVDPSIGWQAAQSHDVKEIFTVIVYHCHDAEPEPRQHIVWEGEKPFLSTGIGQCAWKEKDTSGGKPEI